MAAANTADALGQRRLARAAQAVAAGNGQAVSTASSTFGISDRPAAP